MTQDELHALLIYEPESGAFFRRRKDGSKGKRTGRQRTTTGRCYIEIDGRRTFAHQVAFLYFHGWLPDLIDHANGDPTDNRITNIRPATVRQNAMNRRQRVDSRLRFKGVRLDKRRGQFFARITINGRRKMSRGFATDVEAAYQYDLMSLAGHGEYGRRNFLPLVTEGQA